MTYCLYFTYVCEAYILYVPTVNTYICLYVRTYIRTYIRMFNNMKFNGPCLTRFSNYLYKYL